MKIHFLILLLIGWINTTCGQAVGDSLDNNIFTNHTLKSREIGIRFQSVYELGVIFKFQKREEKQFYRVTLGFADYTLSRRGPDRDNRTLKINFAFGKEKRKQIRIPLYFIHGLEPGIRSSFAEDVIRISQQSHNRFSLIIEPYLGYILGVHYQINKQLYINMEMVPTVSAIYTVNKNTSGFKKDYHVTGNLDSSSVFMTVAYCF